MAPALLLLALALVPTIRAQVSALPQCALGCANAAATKLSCATTDTPCLCKTSFPSTVLQCSGSTSCSDADKTKVSEILEQLCDAVSVSASGSSSSPSTPTSSAPPASTPLSSSEITVTTTITSLSPPLTTTFTLTFPASSSPTSATAPSISMSHSSFPIRSPTSAIPSPSPSPSTGAAARAAGTEWFLTGLVAALLHIAF
ncbi:hypothetical protein MKEN_00872300 [Mycena kentingensis (nom. inval.)]|nr:hypothetical protein MKEN_00872300 [Mycena kentingensis (nom. inval.)]